MKEHDRTGPVDMVTWGLSRVTMWGPAFIVGIMFYEVVMRYVFVSPTLWVNEMSLWAAGGVFLTAGLYAGQQRSHIRIPIIYDMAPRPVRKFFDLLSTLCVLIFVAAVLYGGYGEAWTKLMRWETFGTAWDPPIPATIKPLILVTLLLLAIQQVSNLIYDWNRDPESADLTDEFDLPDDIMAQRDAARGEAAADRRAD